MSPYTWEKQTLLLVLQPTKLWNKTMGKWLSLLVILFNQIPQIKNAGRVNEWRRSHWKLVDLLKDSPKISNRTSLGFSVSIRNLSYFILYGQEKEKRKCRHLRFITLKTIKMVNLGKINQLSPPLPDPENTWNLFFSYLLGLNWTCVAKKKWVGIFLIFCILKATLPVGGKWEKV